MTTNSSSDRIFTDPALLPRPVAIRILSLAHNGNYEDAEGRKLKLSETQTAITPLLTFALVSKRWLTLLKSDEAKNVLWRRVSIYDIYIPRQHSSFILHLDCDTSILPHPKKLAPLSGALGGIIASATQLKTLRLTGALPAGEILTKLAPNLSKLTALSSVYLSAGEQATWHLDDAVRALAALPALEKLEIRCNNDLEGLGSAVLESLCALTTLRHLSLQWPLRSALPPLQDLPSCFSGLSQLSTLQVKRVPVQSASPEWLGQLPNLLHLFWDPFQPVDVTGVLPTQLGLMTGLKTLYLEMRPPLILPAGLTALERLALIGRGQPDPELDPEAALPHWEWLEPLTDLVSLRLQGGEITELPEPVRLLPNLSRLELMCNELTAEALHPGPWLKNLQHLHLGCNRIHSFPPALRHATALKTLHLAHQRTAKGVIQGPGSVTQRLKLGNGDVAALLTAPALELIVMGMSQPHIVLNDQNTRGFDWLQKALKHHRVGHCKPVKLTTNELAYELESMEVFRVHHHEMEELED